MKILVQRSLKSSVSVNNEIVGTVSTSERWVNMCCDTRIRLTIDEDGDSCVDVRFKERKL